MAVDRKKLRRSIVDDVAFRAALRAHEALRSAVQVAPNANIARAVSIIERAMLRLCEAIHAYEKPVKAESWRRARALFSRAIGIVGLDRGLPEATRLSILQILECDVLPPIGGLLRWAEGCRKASS